LLLSAVLHRFTVKNEVTGHAEMSVVFTTQALCSTHTNFAFCWTKVNSLSDADYVHLSYRLILT
jgi:hypothetical protein